MSMEFSAAKSFKLIFGRHKGVSIDQLAQDDDGLRYMDWLRGEMEKSRKDWQEKTYEALCAYLDDKAIASETEKAVAMKPKLQSYLFR